MPLSSTRRLELWTRGMVVILTALSLVIIWMTFLSSTLGEKEKTLALQGERLQRSAAGFSAGLANLLGDAKLSLEFLVQQVLSHPEDDPLSSPEFLAMVNLAQKSFSQGVLLRAVAHGGVRLALDPGIQIPPVSVNDRIYYSVQVPYPGVGFYIDAPVISRATGHWTLNLSQSVPPNHGRLEVLFVSLEFPRLDALVGTLSDAPSEVVAVYRKDGTLLYRNPLSVEFPRASTRDFSEIAQDGRPTGILKGDGLLAFHQVEGFPVWVVVSSSNGTLATEWNRLFRGQLLWVILLTGALVGVAALLLILLERLKLVRLTQERLARVDPLTGLLNRRAFLEICHLERARALRRGDALALVLLDLDHFKLINDQFGHQEGDRVLKALAGVLTRTLRTTDALARIGGEEFAVLLPGTALEPGVETAERIRTGIQTITLPVGNLTSSLGLAVWDGVETFDGWYHRADQALYRAKSAGRNRAEVASEPNSSLPSERPLA